MYVWMLVAFCIVFLAWMRLILCKICLIVLVAWFVIEEKACGSNTFYSLCSS